MPITGSSAATRTVTFSVPTPTETFNGNTTGELNMGFEARPQPLPTSTDAALDFSLAAFATPGQVYLVSQARLTFTVSRSIAIFDLPILSVSGFADTDTLITLADFSRPKTAIGSTGPIPPTGVGAGNSFTYSFDVTSLAQSLINARSAAFGVYLQDTSASSSLVSILGIGTAPALGGPVLEITYTVVPEPGSLAMLALGVGGVGVAAARLRRCRG